MSFCVHCGKALAASANRFCPYCGKPLQESKGKGVPAAVAAFGLVGCFLAAGALAMPYVKSRPTSTQTLTPTLTSTPTPTVVIASIQLINSTGKTLELCGSGSGDSPDGKWQKLEAAQELKLPNSKLVFMRYPGERLQYGTALDSTRLWTITHQQMNMNDGGSFPVPGVLDPKTGKVKDGTLDSAS